MALRSARCPGRGCFRLDEHDAGRFQELRYDYAYDVAPAGRTRVVGRRLWRDGYEYRLEYRRPLPPTPAPAYLGQGRQLVASAAARGPGAAQPPRSATAPEGCDDKFYGIAALRIHDDIWEDDCRTIHEFSSLDPAQPARYSSAGAAVSVLRPGQGLRQLPVLRHQGAHQLPPSTCTATTPPPARASTPAGSCRPRARAASGFPGPPTTGATCTSVPPTATCWCA